VGYDLYFHTHPAQRQASELLERLLDEGAAASDDDWEGYRALRDQFYFRANIWAMGTLRELMGRLGMLNGAQPPQPPRPEAYGIADSDEMEGADRDDPQHRAYQAALERWLRYGCEAPGIPAAKLSDNTGWWVTPLEIVSALRQLRTLGGSPVAAALAEHAARGDWEPTALHRFWDDWIDFLFRAARDGDGFRVY
jgi:hypothetical protein